MTTIDGGYDQNDEDAPRWLAENLQGLYQVSTLHTARFLLCTSKFLGRGCCLRTLQRDGPTCFWRAWVRL